MKDKVARILSVVALVVALGAVVFAVLNPAPVDDPVARSTYSTACYREQGGAKWVAGSTCEWEMQSGSTFDLQNGATFDGDGAVSIDNDLTFGEISVQTLVAGSTISSTGVYIPITAASAVTCSTSTCIENGATAGEFIIVVNESPTHTITIDGTGGNVECKSNVGLASNDTLVLLWDGSDWRCLSNYDNS